MARPKVKRPIKTGRLELRVTAETLAELRRLSVETGKSMSAILEAAFRKQHPLSF